MNPFSYAVASDIASASRAAAADPGTQFLAGGTTLVDLMKLDVQRPTQLIDINDLPMNRIEQHRGRIVIGANVKNSDLARHPLIRDRYPVLSQALLSGASPQLRNMATTAGNIMQRTRCYYFRETSTPCNKREPGSGCSAITGLNRIHAVLGASESCIAVHPSDMCVALAALDAVVLIHGPKGEKRVGLVDFHTLPADHPERENVLEPGDLITGVELPDIHYSARSAYLKVRDRAQYAFALASAAVALDLEGANIREARIAIGGVGTKPWRCFESEKLLAGKPAAPASFQLAAEAALIGAKGYRDNSFKIELAMRTIVRALGNVAALV